VSVVRDSPPRRKSRVGRRQEILDAFTQLVAEHGYDLTSVSDIAEHLALSKGTIMYHFGSKDQMLRELCLDFMRRRLAELELIVEHVPRNDERLAALVVSLMTCFRDERAASVAFAREFMRFSTDPVMEDVRDLRRRYLDGIRELLDRGMADGSFRQTDGKIVALQIIGMCHWTWTWYRPSGDLSMEEIGATFVDVITAGLLADSGRKPQTQLPAAIVELRRR
jgi:AcrR family transcriptional regulator